jgi:CRISP-associated protein Cas1
LTTQLNTLFITSEGAYLARDHETVVVKVDGVKRAQVPLLHLAGIMCFGNVIVSAEVMAAMSELGAAVSFFSVIGRFQARVEGLPGGNVLLRRAQFRAADNAQISAALSRGFVAGKIVNARAFLQRAAREAEGERALLFDKGVDELALRMRELQSGREVNVIRGTEGLAARQYWELFPNLIKKQHDAFRFLGRSRRPPKDRVNALLSFGYALLQHDCSGALAAVGLDPAVGFLHEDRPGRLSLALDLMEELRVPVVDRLVVALINREQLREHDLIESPDGGFMLTKEGRKTFLTAWQEAKREVILHPFLDQEMPVQRVPAIQALLLARVLRGDLDEYPPFVIR